MSNEIKMPPVVREDDRSLIVTSLPPALFPIQFAYTALAAFPPRSPVWAMGTGR